MQKPLPTIDEALKTYWGYDSFRPKQREIIESIIAGKDTLALLPTGGGKSLTYQVPALAMEGVCIVITPLIALMKDQVDRLRDQGISAQAIHSGMSRRDIDIALDNTIYGSIKLLYVSPERCATQTFVTRLKQMNVSMIAVDEAHCISQWGYDFRPSYLRIGELREALPETPILALTASATMKVCEDIMYRLKFHEEHLIRGSFARPNLSYAIRYANDKNEQLLRILNNVEGSAIVYSRTRKGCEEITQLLLNEGHDALFYHGGLPHAERSLRQDEWLSGEYRIMVATNAFGMGIDKSDVNVVIHYSMCNSLEEYYQEAGRAGRGGARSYAVLLVSPNDPERVVMSLDNEFPSLNLIKDIYDKICSMLQISYGDGYGSCYMFNLREFCTQSGIYSTTVVNAMKLLQMNNYLTYIEESNRAAQIMFVVSRDDLYRTRVENHDLDSFIKILLRLYDGIFTEYRAVDETYLAMASGYTVEQIKDKLRRLWQMRLIRYIPTNYSAMIYMNSDRLAKEDLFISPDSYKFRQELYQSKLAEMIRYSQNDQQCRSQFIEQYFSVPDAKECGSCDICLAKRRASRNANETKAQIVTLREQILEALADDHLDTKQLLMRMKAEPETAVIEIDNMLREDVILMDDRGRFSRNRN